MYNGGKLPTGMAYICCDIFTFSCCHHEIYFPSFAPLSFLGNLSLVMVIGLSGVQFGL